MAKVYKTEMVPAKPAHEHTSVDHVTCDLCGAKGKEGFWGQNKWTNGDYDIDETTVAFKSGSAYPEGGSYKSWSVDICSNCFNTKLRPWLEQQGAKFDMEESDW